MNTKERQTSNVKRLSSVIFLVLFFGAGCDQSSNNEPRITNDDSVVVALKEVFADNYQTGVEDVEVTINEDQVDFVRGYVSMLDVDNNDFMAFKADNEWSIIYDPDQKPYDCNLLKQYNFPEDMMGGCKVPDVEFTVGDAQGIQKAFADKYQKNVEDITIKVEKYDATHARGSVQFAGELGGGMFLAVKDQGAWDVAIDGNGSYECKSVEPYNFPEDMIQDCN